MDSESKQITKLYSQSAILTIGTILVTVTLFLFKVIFYQHSQVSLYSEFLLAYSIFLFYSLFGYLNVGNPLSNDAYKTRAVKENGGIAEYLLNALYLVVFFSFVSSLMFAVHLALLRVNGLVILQFSLAMVLGNVTLVLVAFFRGIEKIFTSSVLLILKGGIKALLLFIFSFFFVLTATTITFAFLLGEIASIVISFIFLLVWKKRSAISFSSYKPNGFLLKRYFLHCVPLVLISFSFQGFNSYVYTLVKHFVSSETLGFLDVAITFLTFFIAFFNNIGLMLAANSDRFNNTKGFYKFLFTQIFSMTVAITILYEIIAYFIDLDDNLLERVFYLDGSVLARSVMFILPSLSFYVLFNIISGYKQGKRQYYAISFASIFAILLSILPGYFLIKFLALDGAFLSLLIFSFVLAAFAISLTVTDNFEMRVSAFFEQLRKRFQSHKEEPISSSEVEVEV